MALSRATAPPAARRRRGRRIALLAAALSAALLPALGLLASCRPAWYTPRAIDLATLRTDKQDLVNLADRISAALAAGDSIRIELDQAQVNRWLVARNDMWPDDPLPRFGPLRDPQIEFLDGARVRLAATIDWYGFTPVASIELSAASRPDAVSVDLRHAAVGCVRVPVPPLSNWLDPSRHLPQGSTWDDAAHRLILPNRWEWRNGRIPFVIDDVSTTAGRLAVTIAPLARKGGR